MVSAWFVSDIHLKDANERNGVLLLRFLRSLQRPGHLPTHLFFLGDIFDFWVGNHDFYHHKFREIVDEIGSLKRQGVDIQYFEGNHDLHVGEFWGKRYRIPVHTEAKMFKLGEATVRCEHGDFINGNDKAYLKLREILRTPRMESLARRAPAGLMNKFGELASGLSRKNTFVVRRDNAEELREMIREYAQTQYVSKHFDLIVTGHMHVKDDFQFEVNGRKVRSINLGSWYGKPEVLHLTSQGPEWVQVEAL